MTHANDSRCGHRTRRQFTTAALVLLAGVGWAQQVGAAYTHSGGSAASGAVGAGLVTKLVIDPHTPTTLYAGAGCSGVLTSLDGAGSWHGSTTGLTNTAVLALIIDPVTPTKLYVGTFSGVFRSTDSGSTWAAVSTGLGDNIPGHDAPAVYALAIHPTIPTTLYATTGMRVFKSTDGAGTWVISGLFDTSSVQVLAVDPVTPRTIYAGTMGGLFKSTDAAGTWVRTGLLDTVVVDALAVHPTTSDTIYAGAHAGPSGGGVFKSTDAGRTWRHTNSGLPATTVSALAIDPSNPETIYATGLGVFKSTDGGDTWSAVNTGLTYPYVAALAIDPATPTTLYSATFNGDVFKSIDGAATWHATGLAGDPMCGDGFTACGEQCDDGGESATCDANCTLAQCGDGTLNVTAGERCDDANRNPFDGCTNDCTVCGDGTVTPPEECDDGNTSSGDGCDAQCRRPRVVGTGTPESCPEAAFAAALAERSVRFNCGPDPVTITLTSAQAITADTIIDGGGRITLSGGGAVRIFTVDASAALEVRNLTIADQRADEGGGIVNNGALSVTNSTFSGNSADHGGGAIHNNGALSVTNSTFSGNSADHGGAAIYNNGTLSVTNSTFSGNSTVQGDGTIYNSGTARLTNCTLSENGGAVSNVPICGMFGCRGSITLTNTIIAESAGPSCGATDLFTVPITDGGHNLQWPGTSCGETIPSLDPLLDPAGLKDNGGPTQTIALLSGSPAMNGGDADVCASAPVNGVDERGYMRPGSGSSTCSIGAYEYNSPGPRALCSGDCWSDWAVTIDELITLVKIALGTANIGTCTAGDTDHNGQISIDEIIRAVDAALNGCPVPVMCGGIAGLPCPTGEVCNLRDPTCRVADLAGTCVRGALPCPSGGDPVCGCDAVTYPNDCTRLSAGATLAYAGACAGGP